MVRSPSLSTFPPMTNNFPRTSFSICILVSLLFTHLIESIMQKGLVLLMAKPHPLIQVELNPLPRCLPGGAFLLFQGNNRILTRERERLSVRQRTNDPV